MFELFECFLSFLRRRCCIKELDKKIKLVDLKLVCALEAPEGKKLQTLCLYIIDLAILAFWNHFLSQKFQDDVCYVLDEIICPSRLLEGC